MADTATPASTAAATAAPAPAAAANPAPVPAASTTATVSVDVSQSQPDHVTLNVVAKPTADVKDAPAAAAAAPPSGQQAAAAAKPPEADTKKQPAPAANPQPAAAAPNPGTTTISSTTTSSSSSSNVFQRTPDDFYNTIFYFSGMGSVIGSALAEGIYVNEKNRRNAIDAEIIENSAASKSGKGAEELVVTARGQAQNLSTDFHRLHSLLDALPIYTGSAPVPGVERRGGDVDQPIHGELYFRCKERFPVQPGATGSRPHSRMSGGQDAASTVSGGGAGGVEERPVRRRQWNDDQVLADVARAAVESFPLLPPPQRSSSRGQSPSISMSPSPGPYGQAAGPDQTSSRRRRHQEAENRLSYDGSSVDGSGRPPSSSGQRPGGVGPGVTYVDGSGVKSWQMSHVRQYDVSSGY